MTITAIKDALAALTPTYDTDVDVNVWGYSIKATLNESECPVRMFLNTDDKNRAEFSFIGMGKASNLMTWDILDRLLMFPVNLDKGIENYNHRIDLYKEAYVTAVKADNCLGQSAARVTGITFDGPHVINFPDIPSGTAYWAVDAVVTVEEYV